MSESIDPRSYKKALRSHYRNIRKNIGPAAKAEKDRQILAHILSAQIYRDCRLLLSYISIGDEADTQALIRRALEDGKTVAAPCCLDNNGYMEFYRINSLEELHPRTLGILEPEAREENRIAAFEDSLCILPGLAFDRYGYRLGYGGGYYDRFLSRGYTGNTVGICCQDCLIDRLHHESFDIASDRIVTELGMVEALVTTPPHLNLKSLPPAANFS